MGAIPRLVIGGVSSGTGKTTVMVGLVAALRARGMKVAVFKCGPDYLDPSYHGRAAGAPSHNLDGWMMGRDAVLRTFARASQGFDVALIEGVMGLFDGATPTGEEGSSAQIAKWLEAPVLLVIDASGMARTIAAVAKGFGAFDPALALRGIVANRLGGRGHLDLLRETTCEPRIVGGLPVRADIAFPERHLGLRTADESVLPDASIASWGAIVSEWLDLDDIVAIARAAPALPSEAELQLEPRPRRCRVGIARDDAFHFYYEENLRRLEELGAELVPFSPIADAAPPDVDGLYLGGGYPEVHAAALASNGSMRTAIARLARDGTPIYAECGGLMYLASAIRTLDGTSHPMVGLFEGEVVVHDKLQALGYVEVELQAPSILGPPGTRFRGHQFRYSDLAGVPPSVERVYSVRRRYGGDTEREGFQSHRVLGSYVHAHFASNPLVASAFVDACSASGRPPR